ncbi:MAG: hypothetical protein PHE93_03525 [Clostridia bacterium]|nr:hypothetical protein [Clostridia bacterium]
MNFKRIFALVLAVAIILASSTMLFACNSSTTKTGAVYNENWTPEKKQAMLLIPGLMASSFYNLDEENYGEELWGGTGFFNLISNYFSPQLDKLNSDFDALYPNEDFSSNVEYVDAKNAIIQQILNGLLVCDDNGIPNKQIGISNMSSSERFASFNGMKYVYDILFPLYSDQYDIIVWQYDWRGSVDNAGDELARFIDQCGYEKVQFFTHSLGSIVVANWLQEKNHRDMTELFVPFGGPFLGSMDAVTNLFSDTTESGMIADLLSSFNLSVDLTQVTTTMPSVYQLLPFTQFFDSTGYESESPIKLNGENTTFEDFYNELVKLDMSAGDNGTVKSFVEDLADYQNRYFVKASYDEEEGKYVEDENGQYVHVTWLVPTEYIVGVGKSTIKTADLSIDSAHKTAIMTSSTADATEFDATDSIYNKYIGMIVTSEMTVDEGAKVTSNSIMYTQLHYGAGDGTVPAYSASAGLPLDADNVHLVYNISHGPLANNSDRFADYSPDDLTGLAYLKGIMKNYIEKTDLQMADTIADAGTTGVILSGPLTAQEIAGQVVAYSILGLIGAVGIAYVTIKAVKSGMFVKKK